MARHATSNAAALHTHRRQGISVVGRKRRTKVDLTIARKMPSSCRAARGMSSNRCSAACSVLLWITARQRIGA